MEPATIALPSGTGVYHVNTRTRVFASLLALLVGLIAWFMLRLSDGRDPVAWGFTVLAGVPAAWFALASWTHRLQLDRQHLVFGHLFGQRQLRLATLRGARTRYSQHGRSVTIFQPRDGKPLTLLLPYATDRCYEAWLAKLPDLDTIDRADGIRRLLADPRHGATAQERERRRQRWARLAHRCDVAAVLLMLWTLIFPRPYPLAIASLALAPWLAIALVAGSRGMLRTGVRVGDARPAALGLLLVGPAMLALRALLDPDLLDWGSVWMLGVVAGLPLWLAITATQHAQERRPGALLFYFGLCCFYGTGAAALGNVLLDDAAAEAWPATVAARKEVRGKHATYWLYLDGKQPPGHGDEYEVSAGRYRATVVGDRLCVWSHPGRLRLRWVELADCPR